MPASSHEIEQSDEVGWSDSQPRRGLDNDRSISSDMNADVLNAWGISEGLNVGPFSRTQAEFLQHHRTHVFRG